MIRIATERDAAALAAIYAPVVRDTAISFEVVPPDAEAFREKIRDILKLAPYLVFEDRGEVLGYAYAGPWRPRAAYRFTVETTVYVRGDAARRGIGRALYADLLARVTRQGFRTAVAGITMPNPASVALHEAVGFRKVGIFHAVGFKFGKWHDVGWWERELGPRIEAPPEPLPVERGP